MVYGAFDESIMRKAYEELLRSGVAKADLMDIAVDICTDLDRLLVDKIWPAKSQPKRIRHQDKKKEVT